MVVAATAAMYGARVAGALRFLPWASSSGSDKASNRGGDSGGDKGVLALGVVGAPVGQSTGALTSAHAGPKQRRLRAARPIPGAGAALAVAAPAPHANRLKSGLPQAVPWPPGASVPPWVGLWATASLLARPLPRAAPPAAIGLHSAGRPGSLGLPLADGATDAAPTCIPTARASGGPLTTTTTTPRADSKKLRRDLRHDGGANYDDDVTPTFVPTHPPTPAPSAAPLSAGEFAFRVGGGAALCICVLTCCKVYKTRSTTQNATAADEFYQSKGFRAHEQHSLKPPCTVATRCL
jgi:hypothetical protein